MESNFNNRDFERFVKQNADQYRMFPSEKVWEGVHDALHSRRRWYGIGLVLLFITAAIVTSVMLVPGGKNNDTLATTSAKTTPAKKEIVTPVKSAAFAPAGPVKLQSSANHHITLPEGVTQQFFAAAQIEPAGNLYSPEDITTDAGAEPGISLNALAVSNPVAKLSVRSQQLAPGISQSPDAALVASTPVATATGSGTDAKPGNLPVAASKKPVDEQDTRLPLIPERRTRAITRISKKKLNWQLYLTPTVSYRSLSENTGFISQARYNNIVNGTGGGAAYYSTDVNTMVNHKPDLGFQLGLRGAYPVSRWFSLTGGLQFSVSKYDIKAYDHPAEMATIALTDRSVSTVSSLRNTGGYKENWLRNFYFSASLPIGAELKLSDGTNNYFGIAGTIQPTYVLDNRAYLISTDYKNYAEVPSLTRRWNMNTSFEIFSAHTTGKVHWRVGPQVRYQTMSSFVKNYPIKEHLFDFGLKLGIQLK